MQLIAFSLLIASAELQSDGEHSRPERSPLYLRLQDRALLSLRRARLREGARLLSVGKAARVFNGAAAFSGSDLAAQRGQDGQVELVVRHLLELLDRRDNAAAIEA